MLGGPWLAVIVFILIAIGLGWGLLSLFQQGLDNAKRTSQSGELAHDFDPDAVYQLDRDLMLGYLADGRVVLLPGREDLPRGTPGRRSAVSIAEYRLQPEDYPEHIGVVEAGTRVRFVEVIDDPNNPQTRILVMTRVLTGPYAGKVPALGMHLESADRSTEQTRYVPRTDLFTMLKAEEGPIQSEAPATPTNDE